MDTPNKTWQHAHTEYSPVGAISEDEWKALAEVPPPAGTGFREVDLKFRGFYPGELTVLCGGRGVGKRQFLLQTALHAARQNKKVLFISRTASLRETAAELSCLAAGVAPCFGPGNKYLASHATALHQAGTELASLKINVSDNLRMSVGNYERIFKHQKNFADVVLIDSLEHLPELAGSGEDATIPHILYALHQLARKHSVAVAAGLNTSDVAAITAHTSAQWLDAALVQARELPWADNVLLLERSVLDNTGVSTLHVVRQRYGKSGKAHLAYDTTNGTIARESFKTHDVSE